MPPSCLAELISLQGKTCASPLEQLLQTPADHPHVRRSNFFERRVGEYAKANVMTSVSKVNSADSILTKGFTLEADF